MRVPGRGGPHPRANRSAQRTASTAQHGSAQANENSGRDGQDLGANGSARGVGRPVSTSVFGTAGGPYRFSRSFWRGERGPLREASWGSPGRPGRPVGCGQADTSRVSPPPSRPQGASRMQGGGKYWGAVPRTRSSGFREVAVRLADRGPGAQPSLPHRRQQLRARPGPATSLG